MKDKCYYRLWEYKLIRIAHPWLGVLIHYLSPFHLYECSLSIFDFPPLGLRDTDISWCSCSPCGHICSSFFGSYSHPVVFWKFRCPRAQSVGVSFLLYLQASIQRCFFKHRNNSPNLGGWCVHTGQWSWQGKRIEESHWVTTRNSNQGRQSSK